MADTMVFGRSVFGCCSCAVPGFPFQADVVELKMCGNIYKDCKAILG